MEFLEKRTRQIEIEIQRISELVKAASEMNSVYAKRAHKSDDNLLLFMRRHNQIINNLHIERAENLILTAMEKELSFPAEDNNYLQCAEYDLKVIELKLKYYNFFLMEANEKFVFDRIQHDEDTYSHYKGYLRNRIAYFRELPEIYKIKIELENELEEEAK